MATDTFANPVSYRDEVDMRNATNVYHKSGAMTSDGLSAAAEIARTQLATNTSQPYPIPLTQLRVWDALQTNLPGTAASDDLEITTGTFGTNPARLRTSDAKATTVTQRARFIFPIPIEYVAAASFVIRVRSRMITTVSDGTATVDIEAYRHDEDGGIGSDLCATSAASINSLTAGNDDFTITATTLSPGDTLDVRVTIAITDTATGTAVIGQISRIACLLSVQG